APCGTDDGHSRGVPGREVPVRQHAAVSPAVEMPPILFRSAGTSFTQELDRQQRLHGPPFQCVVDTTPGPTRSSVVFFQGLTHAMSPDRSGWPHALHVKPRV